VPGSWDIGLMMTVLRLRRPLRSNESNVRRPCQQGKMNMPALRPDVVAQGWEPKEWWEG
jgi:hypothetical protein